MNIRQLEYFTAVADSLNFTKAAKGLFVSQTAVTQQIKALEKELDLELFYRNKRHVALTPAGKIFLGTARNILRELQDSLDRCHSVSAGITGSLSIGIVKDYAAVDFVDVLEKFCREYPNIALHFLRLSAGELHEALLSGKADLALNIKFKSDHFPGLTTKDLHQASLLAVLSPDHPLARKLSLTRLDLQPETLFLLTPQGAEAERAQQEMSRSLFPAACQPKEIRYLSDAESILLLAATRQGIGLIPDYEALLSRFREKVKIMPLENSGTPVTIAAEWNEQNENPSLPYLLKQL